MRISRKIAALSAGAIIAGFWGLFLASAALKHPPDTAGRTVAGEMEYGGRARFYLVHIPAGPSGRMPLPLVLVLHGATQSPEGIERMSGMSAKADREGFLAAYPSGTGRFGRVPTWNAGNCCGYALKNSVDDVGFLRSLIERLRRDYPVDGKRIYVTGISNGGMMTYRLGCELADTIAAIAPVEGAQNIQCGPAAPVSVIVFHGTADRLVPFEGGATPFQLGPRRSDASVAEAVAFWVKKDGCRPAPLHEESSDVHTDVYSGCEAGTGVALYAIQGGRHMWPGAFGFGKGISATDLMWSFFASHPRQ